MFMFNYFIVLKYDKIIINELQDITKFNISVRYDDYNKTFYKKCTEKCTEKNKGVRFIYSLYSLPNPRYFYRGVLFSVTILK